MRPTIAQLEAFYWIAKLGSVKEAARQLNVSQPTISLRVDDLEAQLGVQLFEKVGRGLVMTHRGEALLPRAGTVLDELSTIREQIAGAEAVGGVIRIGCSETFARTCLTALVQELKELFPALQIDMDVSTSVKLEEDVLERQLDVAFAVNPLGDARLALVSLGNQAVGWAASPLLGLPAILRPADLLDVMIITNPHPSPMYRQIIDWFRAGGLEPINLWRCSIVTVAAQLVAAGLGVSLLPRKLIEPDIAEGRIVMLDSRSGIEPSRLYAIYRFADRNLVTDHVVRLASRIALEKCVTSSPY